MSSYSDKQHLDLALAEYKGYKLNSKVKLEDGTIIGRVSDKVDNATGNGEQFYTITNGDDCVPPTASEAQRSSVKEITILMKGSTEPLGGADWVTDWFSNDLPMGSCDGHSIFCC
ncbi:hypothetical protein [Streptococcus zhangguiae]|uniref:Uncharacterized protein n=1 Tax=Streptococcus zhangguiae TaxID=2664091 RepID=A0A6I4R825_9STRE|nr:hypothetical protein [Streptococcus sp. zg-70]MWV55936.1 hypothetical protein [Streptococcus sp. zg-70]